MTLLILPLCAVGCSDGDRNTVADAARVDAALVVDVSMDASMDAQVADATPANCSAAPIALASGFADPLELVLHNDRLYWVDKGTSAAGYSDGAVLSVSKYGGEVTPIAVDQARPLDLAVDDTHVYWVNGASTTNGAFNSDGAVMRAPLSGGAAEPLLLDAKIAEVIAIDADDVYFARDLDASASDDWEVLRIPKSGGTAQPFVTGQDIVERLAVDDTHVYWTSFGAGFRRIAKSGGTAEPLQSSPSLMTGMAMTAPYVYFLAYTARFYRYDKSLNDVGFPVSIENAGPRRMVVDDQYAYWTNGVSFIARLPLAGGSPTHHIDSVPDSWGIAIDDLCIYWTQGTGEIMMRRKE